MAQNNSIFPTQLNAKAMKAYIEQLNDDSEQRYGGIGTICSDAMIDAHVATFGPFKLGVIDHTILDSSGGAQDRFESVFRMVLERSIDDIPPIVIHQVLDGRIMTFDGNNRAAAAARLGKPILGYVAKGQIPMDGFRSYDA